jgi:hypothetical protein
VHNGRRDAMDGRTVARLNIEYLQRRLAAETDEAKRAMILRLLAEEEAKLQAPSMGPDQKRERR